MTILEQYLAEFVQADNAYREAKEKVLQAIDNGQRVSDEDHVKLANLYVTRQVARTRYSDMKLGLI